MSELVEILLRPELNDPTLIIALDGWIDAGGAADTAAERFGVALELADIAGLRGDGAADREVLTAALELAVVLEGAAGGGQRDPHVAAVIEAHRGLYGEPHVDKWTFSTNLVATAGRHGIPGVGFGPGKEAQAHAPNELQWKDDLVRCAALYAVT